MLYERKDTEAKHKDREQERRISVCQKLLQRVIAQGFTSRLAAVKAAVETGADFTSSIELNAWLEWDEVKRLSGNANWPTPESRILWNEFQTNFTPPEKRIWTVQIVEFPVSWADGIARLTSGEMVALQFSGAEQPLVMSPAYEILGRIPIHFSQVPVGLFRAIVGEDVDTLEYRYYGPDDIGLEAA